MWVCVRCIIIGLIMMWPVITPSFPPFDPWMVRPPPSYPARPTHFNVLSPWSNENHALLIKTYMDLYTCRSQSAVTFITVVTVVVDGRSGLITWLMAWCNLLLQLQTFPFTCRCTRIGAVTFQIIINVWWPGWGHLAEEGLGQSIKVGILYWIIWHMN